jgi:hypothetical protein
MFSASVKKFYYTIPNIKGYIWWNMIQQLKCVKKKMAGCMRSFVSGMEI